MIFDDDILIMDFFFSANSETTVQQNGGPVSLNLSTESTEPDYVVVESESPADADAPVTSETVETVIQTEEVKERKAEEVNTEPPADVESVQEKETSIEHQTDVSPPATDPQQVSINVHVHFEKIILAIYIYIVNKSYEKTKTNNESIP